MNDVPGTLEASLRQLSDLTGILQGILEKAVIAVNQVLTALEEPLEPGTQTSRP